MQAAFLFAPALVAFVAIFLMRGSAVASHLADHPNERSLHVAPTPRIGGIGIMVAAVPFMAYAADAALAAIVAAACFVALVSLLDDRHGLPIEVRLPAHAVAAAVALLALPAAATASVPWTLALAYGLAIAWAANLFNFMDGADGLAGGMALVGFAAYAHAARDAGHLPLAWASVALAAASAGFLAHNFPPARVFMGDAGSVPLGYFAGALGVYGIAVGAWGWWFPLLTFAPFVLDATVTLARRLARGERVWKAHREHFYQRLVLSGWSTLRLALAAYALMAACALTAVLLARKGTQTPYAIIAAWAGVHALLFLAIERRFRKAARVRRTSPTE
jgi:UDP-N-acetylmuramyl pentapeptide phosphotransferase/UDP-N-acetylglucosamine-1-phosphate transferase